MVEPGLGSGMNRLENTVKKLMIAALLGLTLFGAQAHHSYASFEMDKSITIEGVVTKWEWTNPHTFLYLNVKAADGSVQAWEIESVSPSMLGKAGFSRDTFKVGEKISVKFSPHRTKPNFGAYQSATLPDGKVMQMGGPGGLRGAVGTPTEEPAK